jgi:hypothetical protein
VGVAGGSAVLARAASRTAAAVSAFGAAAPFCFDMSTMVTGFLLALDEKFDLGRCLDHVGTEGHFRVADRLHAGRVNRSTVVGHVPVRGRRLVVAT